MTSTKRRHARRKMLPTFKDYQRQDNQDVFINLKEFGEYATIDGVTLQVQVQYRTERYSALQSQDYETLHGDFVKIFFRTADYCGKNERLPYQGEYCHINGKRYKVQTCKDEMGITRLVVSSYRQEQLRQTPFQRFELGGLDD